MSWYRVSFSGRLPEGAAPIEFPAVEDWVGVDEKLAEAFGFDSIDSIHVAPEPAE